jgi:hypothetical protein
MNADGTNERLILKPKRADAGDFLRIDWAVK